MTMKYIVMAMLLIASMMCHGSTYMNENNNSVIYSDEPMGSSKQINTEDANTISTQPVSSRESAVKDSGEPVSAVYSMFAITSPVDQETIQNQPEISVKMKLQPQLHEGDKIQLLVDGKPFGAAMPDLNQSLKLLERDTYQISAVIVDANHMVKQQSNTVTIYVHRASAQTSPAFAPKANAVAQPLGSVIVPTK